jgi:hypothetical protein
MSADSATLTVIIVDFRRIVRTQFNASFWTIHPANTALGAFFAVNDWSEGSPRASLTCASNARARERSDRQIILVLRGLCHWAPP